ncbi:AAA family ATPase [Aeromonas veronii]|uniref:AAA family ATPase n=1 Tax=Aeromonas veronii TaxID=654 RepID=UPI003BA04460
MIKSIGIKNLRSFQKETKIELKPLTVFVGKNSSGKSSFLRVFPLLRQSVEANTTGPILWFGRYVDFGDFNEAVSNLSPSQPIGFHFELDMDIMSTKKIRPRRPQTSIVSIDLDVVLNKFKTDFKRASITIDGLEMEIQEKNPGESIIELSYKDQKITKENIQLFKENQFIPSPSLPSNKKEELNKIKDYIFDSFYMYEADPLSRNFLDSAVTIARKFFHANTETQTIRNLLKKVPFSNKEIFLNLLRFIFREQKTFIKHLKENSDEVVDALYPYCLGWNLTDTINLINRELNSTFLSVRYIAPLRATTERYYRFQDLQVEEIDHTGSNLAMLLNSLKPTEQRDFASWTKENFGFSVVVKEVGAHYAVKIISPEDNKEYNISDMGFGYSQVLPIIISIWLETERKKNTIKTSKIFVIEQPELHLHPSYQAKLGELFSKVIDSAKNKKLNIKIIFETHSQSIIDALGEMIETEECNLTNDDVSVILFEKSESGCTDVFKSEFDSSGYLMNWPIGFFSGK